MRASNRKFTFAITPLLASQWLTLYLCEGPYYIMNVRKGKLKMPSRDIFSCLILNNT